MTLSLWGEVQPYIDALTGENTPVQGTKPSGSTPSTLQSSEISLMDTKTRVNSVSVSLGPRQNAEVSSTPAQISPLKPNSASTTQQIHDKLTPAIESKEISVQRVATATAVADAARPMDTQTIDAIKHRYIVGKYAGADLLSRSGQLLVHRGEVITSAVVKLAEQDGKLVELIVNMVIEGFGE